MSEICQNEKFGRIMIAGILLMKTQDFLSSGLLFVPSLSPSLTRTLLLSFPPSLSPSLLSLIYSFNKLSAYKS